MVSRNRRANTRVERYGLIVLIWEFKKDTMKEFIWQLKCMILAKKNRHKHEQINNEYYWYRYLVVLDIRNFFARLKFWRSSSDIPF